MVREDLPHIVMTDQPPHHLPSPDPDIFYLTRRLHEVVGPLGKTSRIIDPLGAQAVHDVPKLMDEGDYFGLHEKLRHNPPIFILLPQRDKFSLNSIYCPMIFISIY